MKPLILILACVLMCGCETDDGAGRKVTLYGNDGKQIRQWRNVYDVDHNSGYWIIRINENGACIRIRVNGILVDEPETASEKE